MDTATHSFNTAAAGTGLSPFEFFVIWAAIVDDDAREKRRKEWRREFNSRAARGLHPVPPWPRP